MGETRHNAPDHDCHCGLYGLHEYGTTAGFNYGDTYPWAVIQAWGKMQVHRDGFRAEFAEIMLLGISSHMRNKSVLKMAERYNVPLVQRTELQREAQRFGRVVPESLRPTKAEIAQHKPTWGQSSFTYNLGGSTLSGEAVGVATVNFVVTGPNPISVMLGTQNYTLPPGKWTIQNGEAKQTGP